MRQIKTATRPFSVGLKKNRSRLSRDLRAVMNLCIYPCPLAEAKLDRGKRISLHRNGDDIDIYTTTEKDLYDFNRDIYFMSTQSAFLFLYRV